MKNFLRVSVVIALLVAAHDSFSQFNKGRFIAAGSVRLSSSNNALTGPGSTSESSTSSFGFSPSVGYFIVNNLAVGASLGLSTSSTTFQASGSNVTNSSAAIGPFVRYYLPRPVFFQAAAMFGSAKYKATGQNGSEATFGQTQLGLAAGYAWLLNDFVALEPMVGYQSFSYNDKDSDNKTKEGSFYLSCALTIYLGERK